MKSGREYMTKELLSKESKIIKEPNKNSGAQEVKKWDKCCNKEQL